MYTVAHVGTIAVVEPGVCYPVLGWSATSAPVVANYGGGTRSLNATEYVWVGEISMTPEKLRPNWPNWGSIWCWRRLDWDDEDSGGVHSIRWRGKAGQ
jgi:hypothetical protein